MKEKIKFIVYMMLFCVFMIVAMFGYKLLLEKQNGSKNDEIIGNDINKKSTKLEEFEVYINENEKINVKQLIGKPIVINIWTSWCTYCAIEMEYFDELYLKEKDNIHFMMINATADRDSIENADNFIKQNKFSFRPYYDLELDALRTLGVYSYPTTIFVNKKGYIVSTKIGSITKEELRNRIERLK